MPSRKLNSLWLALGAGVGVAVGWAVAQQMWALNRVSQADVSRTLAYPPSPLKTGRAFENVQETEHWTRLHTIDDGIERIAYAPKQRKFKTPLVLQHGMWHGAWCWQTWQEALAEWGWETHAHSLPGHAASPTQRPIPTCTLDYYLAFLEREVQRIEGLAGQRPALIGHSMGGALIQWYLKYVGDNLPAAVLVAPWVSHSTFEEGLLRFWQMDPVGCLATSFSWAAEFVRDPEHTARALLSPNSVYSPEELFARLTPESVLVLYQHNPPFWQPPTEVHTPLLWLAAESDTLVSVAAQWRSAQHYNATFQVCPGAHDLMLEADHRASAQNIQQWLVKQNIS